MEVTEKIDVRVRSYATCNAVYFGERRNRCGRNVCRNRGAHVRTVDVRLDGSSRSVDRELELEPGVGGVCDASVDRGPSASVRGYDLPVGIGGQETEVHAVDLVANDGERVAETESN